MQIDKYYIIQIGKSPNFKTYESSARINWIAHNPTKSPVCLDHFIRLARLKPHNVFKTENAITTNFVGKICDIIDILEHAKQKKYGAIIILRPYVLRNIDSSLSIQLNDSYIYPLFDEFSCLDAALIINKDNFFARLISLLRKCSNPNDIRSLIFPYTRSNAQFASVYRNVPKEEVLMNIVLRQNQRPKLHS